MSKAWPKVRLGEVLKRSTEPIEPTVDAEYREITVRLWAKVWLNAELPAVQHCPAGDSI